MAQNILLNGKIRTIKDGADVNAVITRLTDGGNTVEKINKPPTMVTLNRWVTDGVAKATDGCICEPDGTCRHGKQSWLLVMGLI